MIRKDSYIESNTQTEQILMFRTYIYIKMFTETVNLKDNLKFWSIWDKLKIVLFPSAILLVIWSISSKTRILWPFSPALVQLQRKISMLSACQMIDFLHQLFASRTFCFGQIAAWSLFIGGFSPNLRKKIKDKTVENCKVKLKGWLTLSEQICSYTIHK